MSKLQGKTAIVTGATSGMGRATALLFAREGAAVVASGRHSERGLALVDEIRAGGGRAEFVPGDVSLPETNERLVAECRRAFGGVDTAVCCAGMLGLGSATDVAVETWKRTLAVNLDAVFYLLRSALPALQERGGGSIVVVGSIAAFKGFPNHAAYCASKGASSPSSGRSRSTTGRRSASTRCAPAPPTRRSSGSPRWRSRIPRRQSKTSGRGLS
jgi:NAD(P)-dependent dehydrogenase (short-subunit alcohol dehydrogenase family)